MPDPRLRPTGPAADAAYVDLSWLPLGAGPGSALVRASGRAFEAVGAARQHRPRAPLFHSALEVRVDGVRRVVEMTPDWSRPRPGRQVVVRGPVGLGVLGRSRWFRYEVHRWRDGRIDDAVDADDAPDAVDSPRRLSRDRELAGRLLAAVPGFPAATWGRDTQQAGEMWNSNSLTAWLLAVSGHDVAALAPPDDGRAPGWSAGLVVARRDRPPRTPAPPVTPVLPAARP